MVIMSVLHLWGQVAGQAYNPELKAIKGTSLATSKVQDQLATEGFQFLWGFTNGSHA
jgi:hypothetical protein